MRHRLEPTIAATSLPSRFLEIDASNDFRPTTPVPIAKALPAKSAPIAMLRLTRLLTTLVTCSICAHFAVAQEDDDSLYLIEIEGFQVFSNLMKIVDGSTGKEYVGDHPVILGFRKEFDTILTKYHQKLLIDEAKKLKERAETIKPFSDDLAALAKSFGIEGFEVKGPHLTREFSIFKRMVKDPFFNIEELVVWDLRTLNLKRDNLPNNKYAKNIRFNEETGKWERRITTKWEVSYISQNERRTFVYTFKEQGLNLDTNKGYHLIDTGLRADIPPNAFQDVGLQYPIFYNTGESTDVQIRNLSRDFVENLYYLYDPFSWVARGNTRFRGGFSKQILEHIKKQPLPVKDREWFDRVLADFLNDIVTIKYWGADDIYDLQMLSSNRKNRNQLGEDLDLLNWHKNEKRKVDYDPAEPNTAPRLSFENQARARYILLDAYRRYGDTFVDSLRKRLLNVEGKADAQQLVKDALAEASGLPADKYIPAAIKAQQAELARFL